MGGSFNICREIGGRIYPGEINEKAAAQKQYDAAKKKGQSAGQVKQQWVLNTRSIFQANITMYVIIEITTSQTHRWNCVYLASSSTWYG